jgi:hypothetical protein
MMLLFIAFIAIITLFIGGYYVIRSVINDVDLHFDNDDDEFEYFN